MTGFGGARAASGGLVVEAEVRSVNHRFLTVQLRLPTELSGGEPTLEPLVRKALQRGSVSVALTVRREGEGAAAAVVDLEQARAVAAGLRRIAKDLRLEGDVTLAEIAAAPGVIGLGRAPAKPDERVARLAESAVSEALAELVVAREREGRVLAADLRSRLAAMRASMAEIEERTPAAVAEHLERLRRRLSELLEGSGASLREDDLAREVALLADRSDVTEEMTRLRAHLDETESLLRRAEPVGRRLDFLVQEMLREVNTTGSKSSDSEITRRVIDLKTEIERIREQVANLE